MAKPSSTHGDVINMNKQPTENTTATHNRMAMIFAILRRLESVSYDTIVSMAARLFISATFFLSGRTKVDGFLSLKDSTFFLFEHEYDVPLLPSELAAYMATYAEHFFPLLLLIGFASRLSAAALFGMTLVIAIFVYPGAWAVHLLWGAALAFIIFRGPGAFSIDHLIRRKYETR